MHRKKNVHALRTTRQHSDGGSAPAGEGAFEALRSQFERRRRAEYHQLADAIANVDVTLFTQETPQSGALEFQLRGTLPPTTSFRGNDYVNAGTSSQNEKHTARKLISAHRTSVIKSSSQGYTDQSLDSQNLLHQWGHEIEIRDAHEEDSTCSSPRPKSHTGPADSLIPVVQGQQIANPDQAWDGHMITSCRHEKDMRGQTMKFQAHTQQGEEAKAKQEHVSMHHFERKHRMREAAITTESMQRQRREAHHKYKFNLQAQLLADDIHSRSEKERKHQEAQSRRADVRSRRDARNPHNEATMKCRVIEKIVRQHDGQKCRAQQQVITQEKAQMRKEMWAVRSKQLKSKRLLCEAQKQKRISEEATLNDYFRQFQQQQQQQQVRDTRDRIRADKQFNRYLKEACHDISGPADLAAAQKDMESYEHTLGAFSDLTQGIMRDSLKLRSVIQAEMVTPTLREPTYEEINRIPQSSRQSSKDVLLAAEPRVRTALKKGMAGPDDEDSRATPSSHGGNKESMVDELDGLFDCYGVELEDHEAYTQIEGLPSTSTASLLPSVHQGSAMASVIARPLVSLSDQVPGVKVLSPSFRETSELHTLVALRRLGHSAR